MVFEHDSLHVNSARTAAMFFASTPPLEANRILPSQMTSKRFHDDGRPLEMSFIDIRKAYFDGVPKRKLHLFLPKEMGLGGRAIARLKRCVYGTRDAGMIWEECYSEALSQMGFSRGLASPWCFFRRGRELAVFFFTAMAFHVSAPEKISSGTVSNWSKSLTSS